MLIISIKVAVKKFCAKFHKCGKRIIEDYTDSVDGYTLIAHDKKTYYYVNVTI